MEAALLTELIKPRLVDSLGDLTEEELEQLEKISEKVLESTRDVSELGEHLPEEDK